MSEEPRPYSATYIRAWTGLSLLLGVILIGMFVFGDDLMEAGQVIWALLRWLASPFI